MFIEKTYTLRVYLYIQMLSIQMNIEDLLKTNKQLPASRRIILNLLVTANTVDEQITDLLKTYELTAPQFNVLRILRGQNGKPANLSTIQDRMVNRMSNTTRLVDKLIKKNLAERIICKENRRKVEISIKQEGLNLLKKIDPEISKLENQITSNIDDKELELLNTILNKLRN